MTNELKAEIGQTVSIIDKMLKDKVMDPDTYYKCIVSMSYEYFVDDDISSGLELLARCPPKYFESVQPNQIRKDKQFAEVSLYIMTKLAKLGFINDKNELVLPTQSKGKA